jgi:signal transduction histidine kinase
MNLAPGTSRLPYLIAAGWLITTVSLASWWLAIGLDLAGQLSVAGVPTPTSHFRRMFIWEGATFIGLLMAGGVALVLAIRRENARRQAVEAFFMAFTHDLKTSIASIQLQAEGLHEDWPNQVPRAPIDRLLQEAVRLQIQLENSLFVAQPDGRLLTEQIAAGPAITRLAADWPDLAVRVDGQARVVADARGFDVVVRNLLQNAVVHGGAREVRVGVAQPSSGLVRLTFADDGRGVDPGVVERLGEPFLRPGSTSGTGVGLFVSRRIVTRMHGALRFVPAEGRGLTVQLDLPGAV